MEHKRWEHIHSLDLETSSMPCSLFVRIDKSGHCVNPVSQRQINCKIAASKILHWILNPAPCCVCPVARYHVVSDHSVNASYASSVRQRSVQKCKDENCLGSSLSVIGNIWNHMVRCILNLALWLLWQHRRVFSLRRSTGEELLPWECAILYLHLSQLLLRNLHSLHDQTAHKSAAYQ